MESHIFVVVVVVSAVWFCSSVCQVAGQCSSSDECQNQGTCLNSICRCPPGFFGRSCQFKGPCAAFPGICRNGATCSDDGFFALSCSCPAGFTGLQCDTDINDCIPSPCLNGGFCTDGVDNYTCRCVPGFTGRRCESNIDDCSPNPCHNGATCLDLTGGYNCVCPQGVFGGNCEIDIDDCNPNQCMNGGTCNNLIGDFTCTCPPGYTGKRCYSGKACTYIDVENTAGAGTEPATIAPPTFNLRDCKDACDNVPACVAVDYVFPTCRLFVSGVTTSTLYGRWFSRKTCTITTATPGVNPCQHNQCQNGGRCITSVIEGSYSNVINNTGRNNTNNNNFVFIGGGTNVNYNSGGGTINHVAGNFRCQCPAGFSGDMCQDTASKEGDIRLEGGTAVSSGRLEIFHSGRWGSVCDGDWDPDDASVVCRQLGYDGGVHDFLYNPGALGAPSTTWLSHVDCDPALHVRLDQCTHHGFGNVDCDHDRDVGVICLP